MSLPRPRPTLDDVRRQFDYMAGEFRITPFGQKGVLTHIGTKIQCHICGKPFVSLGAHVWQTHGLSAEQYRLIFALAFVEPLNAPVLTHRLQIINGPRAKQMAAQMWAGLSPDERFERCQRLGELASKRTAQLAALGQLRRTWSDSRKARKAKHQTARWRTHRAEIMADLREAGARLRKFVQAVCVVCGTPFSYPARSPRRVCEPRPSACYAALKRRIAVANGSSETAIQKRSAANRGKHHTVATRARLSASRRRKTPVICTNCQRPFFPACGSSRRTCSAECCTARQRYGAELMNAQQRHHA